MRVLYEKWQSPALQTCTVSGRQYDIATVIYLAKALPVFDLKLEGLYLNYNLGVDDNSTLRDFATHCDAVANADLAFPIILCPDGVILDGRHRVVKALLAGAETIKAVQFTDYPPHR
jgi:hypothetical protein